MSRLQEKWLQYHLHSCSSVLSSLFIYGIYQQAQAWHLHIDFVRDFRKSDFVMAILHKKHAICILILLVNKAMPFAYVQKKACHFLSDFAWGKVISRIVVACLKYLFLSLWPFWISRVLFWDGLFFTMSTSVQQKYKCCCIIQQHKMTFTSDFLLYLLVFSLWNTGICCYLSWSWWFHMKLYMLVHLGV